MKVFANLSIGTRLAAVFALVLALTVLIAGAAILRLNKIADDTSAMMAAPLAKERLMSEWHANTFGAVRRTAAIVKSSDASLAEFFKADGAKTASRSSALIKQIEALLETEDERALFKHIGDLRRIYTDTKDRAIKARTDGDAELSARILNQEYMPSSEAYEGTLAQLVTMQRRRIDTIALDIRTENTHSARAIAVLAAAAVAAGALCSWLLTRGIVGPIRQAVELAQTVASGNLTRRFDAATADETGALLRALRDMNDSLAGIVADVRTGTEIIAGASSEIAAGNLHLSDRTEQQAASLQETAASITQVTARVRQSALHAAEANRMALKASSAAAEGGAVVGEIVTTMDSIKASSRRVVDIIGIIDGIAFQTSILALNASVEAARAGEQGRGFAVVASEVRTLAQRSATAAKEIKTLIDASVRQVDDGSRLVGQAGGTMDQIVESIRGVAAIMADISQASAEQSAGIEQMHRAIGVMDDATLQNAALVEQSAAAAGSMKEQAARLAQAVRVFKLDQNGQKAVPRLAA